MNASLVVVADRGAVKAYKVIQTPARGPSAQLVEEQELREAHERYRDKVTDQAGAFPSGGSAGQGNAIAERMSMETEEDSRLFKAIAQQIEGILRRNQPLSWVFAAPAEINPAILQHVAEDLHKILDQNVKHDLTKVPGHSLLEHFG
jgi:protein required for attachment to host cells